jgi:hypothetical protein
MKPLFFVIILTERTFFILKKIIHLLAATSLENIIGEFSQIKYNQEGLLSYITMGYTPVYQTLYENISRFKTNEYIKISNGKFPMNIFLKIIN